MLCGSWVPDPRAGYAGACPGREGSRSSRDTSNYRSVSLSSIRRFLR